MEQLVDRLEFGEQAPPIGNEDLQFTMMSMRLDTKIIWG